MAEGRLALSFQFVSSDRVVVLVYAVLLLYFLVLLLLLLLLFFCGRFGGLVALSADYLVVELYINVRILVPAHYVQSVFIEGECPVKLTVDIVGNLLVHLRPISALRKLTYIYNVVAHTWHKFYTEVRQHINLLYLITPKVVGHYGTGERRNIEFCEARGHISRYDRRSLVYFELGIMPPWSSR